jgi:hypothetical protein
MQGRYFYPLADTLMGGYMEDISRNVVDPSGILWL